MSARKKPAKRKPQATWKKGSPRKLTGFRLIFETLLEAHATVQTAYEFLRDDVDRKTREFVLTQLHEGVKAIETALDQLDRAKRQQSPRTGGAS